MRQGIVRRDRWVGWGWTLGLVLAGSLEAASRTGLIGLDEPWRYHVAVSPPSDPEGVWREPWFDPGAWRLGAGPFGDATQGIWERDVQLPADGAPWTTVCFRREFIVEDPGEVRWLVLRADYEDGLVVYLNGEERARRSMPEGVPLTLDSPALTAGRKWGETILLGPEGGLRLGTNVLAVEVQLPDEPLFPFTVNLQPNPASGWDLVWPAIPGRDYALEIMEDAGAGFRPWEGEGFPRRAVGREERALLPMEGEMRFYRLRLLTSGAGAARR